MIEGQSEGRNGQRFGRERQGMEQPRRQATVSAVVEGAASPHRGYGMQSVRTATTCVVGADKVPRAERRDTATAAGDPAGRGLAGLVPGVRGYAGDSRARRGLRGCPRTPYP